MMDEKNHEADKETIKWKDIEKILKEPSYKIAWKFNEAKKRGHGLIASSFALDIGQWKER